MGILSPKMEGELINSHKIEKINKNDGRHLVMGNT